MALGKLFKWLQLALRTRKEDIVRRKAKEKRAAEDRLKLIAQKQERATRRLKEVQEAEDKFREDHREEIEAAAKWAEGDHDGDGDDKGDQPVIPVFNRAEFLHQWDEACPEIEIPPPVLPDVDLDWILEPEELQQLIHSYN
mmetsp:Transcript_6926/g.5191  ORF Transcript_6926/g.5191 Transcript_6926/m.5191 type:complete len:141 (+) Transcript_6926:1063-1485(+)